MRSSRRSIRRVLAGAARRARLAGRALTGRAVQCNLCSGWSERFAPDRFHVGTVCPRCRSHLRHRLLAAALRWRPDVHLDRIVAGRDVLHFAPEDAVVPLLRDRAGRYVRADLLVGDDAAAYDVDERLDIAAMPSVGDGHFDVVVACDVLEHVADDRSALTEVHRVLRTGGWAIVTVPQQDGLDVTFEDPTAVTAEERERLFGQSDHLRMYGADVVAMLEQAGFGVVVVDHTSFPARRVRRHALHPPVRSSHSLATNHRRIFFAQRRPG